MTIIATCGHEIPAEWDREHNPIRIKGFARACDRVTQWVTYCEVCQKTAEAEGIVIHDDDEERAWWAGRIAYHSRKHQRG